MGIDVLGLLVELGFRLLGSLIPTRAMSAHVQLFSSLTYVFKVFYKWLPGHKSILYEIVLLRLVNNFFSGNPFAF